MTSRPARRTRVKGWALLVVLAGATVAMGLIVWQSFFHPYPLTVSAADLQDATLVSVTERSEGKASWLDLQVRRADGRVIPVHVSHRGDFSGKQPGDPVQIYLYDGSEWEVVRYDSVWQRTWTSGVLLVLLAALCARLVELVRPPHGTQDDQPARPAAGLSTTALRGARVRSRVLVAVAAFLAIAYVVLAVSARAWGLLVGVPACLVGAGLLLRGERTYAGSDGGRGFATMLAGVALVAASIWVAVMTQNALA